MEAKELRQLIIKSLERQGFRIRGDQMLPPPDLNKDKLRELHAEATNHRVERSRGGLVRYEPKLLDRLARGPEIIPEQILPRLLEVQPDADVDYESTDYKYHEPLPF